MKEQSILPLFVPAELIPAHIQGAKKSICTAKGLEPVNGNPNLWWPDGNMILNHEGNFEQRFINGPSIFITTCACPYGALNQKLYLAEDYRYRCLYPGIDRLFEYRAEEGGDSGNWLPASTMPEVAARYFAINRGVKLQRLHDITAIQAVEDGVQLLSNGLYRDYISNPSLFEEDGISVLQSFKTLWFLLYGEYSYYINPWVWVVSYNSYK